MNKVCIDIKDFEDAFKDTLEIRVTFIGRDASDREQCAEASFSLQRSDLPYSLLRAECVRKAKEILAIAAAASRIPLR